jgi:hypothetical protein
MIQLPSVLQTDALPSELQWLAERIGIEPTSPIKENWFSEPALLPTAVHLSKVGIDRFELSITAFQKQHSKPD